MAILQATPNSVIGNAAYKDKRATLAASSFLLTKEIATQIKWGTKQIEDRQEALAELAVKTWRSK